MPLKAGQHMTLEREGLRVDVENMGEGWGGDYDETDPEDEPLVRFNLEPAGVGPEGFDADGDFGGRFRDTSYCTQFPADATDEDLRALLEYLMARALPVYRAGAALKRTAEALSWVDLDAVRRDNDPKASAGILRSLMAQAAAAAAAGEERADAK